MKNYTLLGTLLLLLVILSSALQAQTLEGTKAKELHPSIKKVRVVEDQQALKNIHFEKDQQPNLENLPAVLNEALGKNNQKSTNGLSLKVVQDKVDNLGFQQVKYQQYYNGIPVEMAMSKAQVKNGKVESIMGRLYQNIEVNTTPALDEKGALAAVQEAFKNATLIGENKDHKHQGHNHKHSTGELAILKYEGQDFLCWKLDVSVEANSDWKVYVDAHTGNIVQSISLIHECFAASGNTTMYGVKSGVNTRKVGSNYQLNNSTCSNEVTLNVKNHATSGGPFYDSDNYWNDNTVDRSAFQTYALFSETIEYFETTFLLDSYDDNGADVIVNNNHSIGNNAFWHPTNLEFSIGRGSNASDGTDDINSSDVVAHEFTHAITQFSAGLIYANESGALNESFSDIFGTTFERIYENNQNPDWLIGEDLAIGHIRSMSNPNSKFDPDTYGGTYWTAGGGVHTNSGVQNHWYYLLTDGGSGTNDLGNSYSVSGIGLTKAAAIAYRSLTEKLTDPNSDYADAREASICAATDLYGDCSNEVQQVMNAWHAVGVGAASNCSQNKPDLIVVNQTVTANAAPGDVITMTSTIENMGSAAAPYTYLMYYLSDDPVWDPYDTYLYYDYVPALAVGAQSNQTHSYVLPSWATGCEYIIFVADYYDYANELNESNNVEAAQYCVSTPTCPKPTAAEVSAEPLCGYSSAYVYCQYHNTQKKKVQYRQGTSGGWTTVYTPNTEHWVYLSNLNNASYQYKVAVECSPGSNQYSAYSNIETFTYSPCKTGGSNLEDNALAEVKVYPNPTQDFVNVNLSGGEAETIGVYDVQGRLLKEVNPDTFIGGTVRIDLSDLTKGIYFIRINDTHVKKITKL